MPVAGRHRGLHSPPVGRNEPARVRDVQLLGKAAKNPVPLGIEIFCGLSGGPGRRPGITENLDRRDRCKLGETAMRLSAELKFPANNRQSEADHNPNLIGREGLTRF